MSLLCFHNKREDTDTVATLQAHLEYEGHRRVLLPDQNRMSPDKVSGFAGWPRAVLLSFRLKSGLDFQM